jgi:hypothetical protein
MKLSFYLIIFSIILSGITLKAQTDFEPYFIYKKGSKIKIGHFNLRSVPQGYSVYTVEDVNETDSISYLTIKVETLDKYQRPINSQNFSATFHEGEISFDKRFMINVDTLAILDEENYNISGKNLVIPAFLGNGISLASAWVELTKNDTTALKISEFSRVVDNFEKIETEIGEFDVCLISSKLETRYIETELLTVNTYYSKGIGPVRINYYNVKRKMIKFSEIVEISIPGKS